MPTSAADRATVDHQKFDSDQCKMIDTRLAVVSRECVACSSRKRLLVVVDKLWPTWASPRGPFLLRVADAFEQLGREKVGSLRKPHLSEDAPEANCGRVTRGN